MMSFDMQLKANKKLGQHFLHDKNILARIIEAADIHPHERVLEIGPGLAVLTKELLSAGAHVVAIEKDKRFIDILRELYIELIQGDALDFDWVSLLEEKDWKFVSNLPYAISSMALRLALYNRKPPTKLVVLLQKEVVDRALELIRPSKKPKGSLLALMVALASKEAHQVCRVPRGAFSPPPKVESAVLSITPLAPRQRLDRWGIDPEEVMKVAKRGFAHPRKLLASNLEIDPSLLGSIGVNPKARPENLSAEQWVQLAKLI